MSYRKTINQFLERFGRLVGIEVDPLDKNGYASVRRGSATIGINVLESNRILLLISPIMPLPNKRELQLYRKLLELNFLHTSDGAFAVDREKGIVCLRALRGLDGLDFAEFVDLLDTVARVADEWDDKLRAEFSDP